MGSMQSKDWATKVLDDAPAPFRSSSLNTVLGIQLQKILGAPTPTASQPSIVRSSSIKDLFVEDQDVLQDVGDCLSKIKMCAAGCW
jgi:hypothetical protein